MVEETEEVSWPPRDPEVLIAMEKVNHWFGPYQMICLSVGALTYIINMFHESRKKIEIPVISSALSLCHMFCVLKEIAKGEQEGLLDEGFLSEVNAQLRQVYLTMQLKISLFY